MACEIISSKGAVFVLWGKPESGDIDLVLSAMRMASDRVLGQIVYITRVPAGAPPPEPEVREHLNKLLPAGMELCSSYHVVLEGTGFLSAMKRGILASLMQISWRRGAFFVHATPKQVLFKVDKIVRSDVEAILNLAEKRGLLTATEPTRRPPQAA
jgi:hypothetical protein